MARFLGTWKRYCGLQPRWWDKLGGCMFEPGTTPKVIYSRANYDNIIFVLFDRPIDVSADAHLAVTVSINGGTAITPNKVELVNGEIKIVAIELPPYTIHAGDTVKWTYSDQHATAKIKGAEQGGVEVAAVSYDTENLLSYIWVDENGNRWVDENQITWKVS